MDYRHRNQQLANFLVPALDLAEIIHYTRDARYLSKFDIIKTFNRLLIEVEFKLLTAFRNRFSTFRWKVLLFRFKVDSR
jgi:hypothetical protein